MKKIMLLLFVLLLTLGCDSEKKLSFSGENTKLKKEIVGIRSQLDEAGILISEQNEKIKELESIGEQNKIALTEKERIIKTYESENELLKSKNIDLNEEMKNRNLERVYWIIFFIVNNALWYGYSRKKRE
ncbi:hypothetical protein [uncultured Ilyobacter sp.]|uniref:hypothetical protein n=1 Tax=uncultured Ilyobacter sp. TaxID=544433 RepID=UPI0029C9600A|nr:hypothetical protein [uncultured Ilyobacter sp.]